MKSLTKIAGSTFFASALTLSQIPIYSGCEGGLNISWGKRCMTE
jgi:hypothetical protein